MTIDQWDEITVMILACWPNREIPEKSFELWFHDLSEFECEQVEAAVLAIYRDGREWAPNGAQIRMKLLELRGGDDGWSQAYGLALEAATSHGGAEYGGLTWLEKQDPLAARAAGIYGWRDFCLSDAPDTTRRAQFRDIYLEVKGSADRHDRYRGLPSAGLAQLERSNGPVRLGEASGRALPAGEERQGHLVSDCGGVLGAVG